MLSRIENILQSIVDSSEYDGPVQSRIEQLLLDVKSVISTGGSGGVTEATVSTMITTAINSLIDSAPDEYNTLGKIAAKLLLTDEQIKTITEQVNDRYTKEETNELVSKIPKFTIEVVTSLPTENISTTTVYLKTGSKSDPDNIYDEYIYVKSKWELLGSQTIDLSGYVTTDTMNTVLSNKLDKSGGTLTGALATQNVNINGTEIFNNIYTKKNLGDLDIGELYKDLDSKYKDGTYHRMWRLRLKQNVSATGRIKVILKSSWNSSNAIGVMSKTIHYGISAPNELYNNVGYYDSLGYYTELDFRISELIWNDTAKTWEILIWQNHLNSNNIPTIILESIGSIIDITSKNVELTQMTSYTAPKASPTGGNKVVNWADIPVFETPYGKEVATEDDIATIVNKYGSKNLLNSSLLKNSTAAGITRTNNGDGSITYSGTSTLSNDTFIPIMASQLLDPGTYIFSANTTTSTSYSYQIYKNKAYWKNIDISNPIEIMESAVYAIGIVLKANSSISDTFKSMLRYAEIKDDTFVPYAMTNRELTEQVIGAGWVTTENLRYRKTGNIIALQGTTTPSSSATSVTLGTLPEGYRPEQDITIAQAGEDIPSRYIKVYVGGIVELQFISNCTASHTYSYNGSFMI